MEYKATQKFVRISPTKIRGIARMVVKKHPREVIEALPFSQKRSSFELVKVMKQVLANALSNGASEQNLFIKEIQINEGPRLKRGRPVSRGRWHPYKKRMSHIRIILGVKEEKKKESKKQKEDKKLLSTSAVKKTESKSKSVKTAKKIKDKK